MVLATFAETKVAWLPGRPPATQNIAVIGECGKKKQLLHRPLGLNWKISRDVSAQQYIAVKPEP